MKRSQSAVENLGLEDRLYNEMLKFIVRRVSNREDAEEILQDIYLKLIQKSDGIEAKKIQGWLLVTTRNAIVDYYRSKKQLTGQISPDQLPSPENDNASDIEVLGSCLTPLLAGLSEEEVHLLKSIDMRGESQKKYADRVQLPYSTLKSKLQRSRQKLRDRLVACCKITLDARGVPFEVEGEKDCC